MKNDLLANRHIGISKKDEEQMLRKIGVSSLDELFVACREAPPSHLVRVSLRGSDGEVRLNFASFLRR